MAWAGAARLGFGVGPPAVPSRISRERRGAGAGACAAAPRRGEAGHQGGGAAQQRPSGRVAEVVGHGINPGGSACRARGGSSRQGAAGGRRRLSHRPPPSAACGDARREERRVAGGKAPGDPERARDPPRARGVGSRRVTVSVECGARQVSAHSFTPAPSAGRGGVFPSPRGFPEFHPSPPPDGRIADQRSKPTLSTSRLAALRLRAISASGVASTFRVPRAASSGSTATPGFTGYS